MYIGCHLSAAKGYAHLGKDALSIGANTFQFFTRNPRGARAKALDPDDMRALLELMNANAFGTIVAHAPYTLNACSSDPHLRELARDMIADDLERMEHLPGNLYNFHPGSHTGQGVETGIAQIADMLNSVLRPGLHTTVLLETMAGKGSEVGSRKDRHARLGEGTIGVEALVRVVRHPALKGLPICLETPNELPGYAAEIRLLRERCSDSDICWGILHSG